MNKTNLTPYLFALVMLAHQDVCQALDLVPSQWNHLPTDTRFIGIAYADSQADIALDPVLKLEDVEMSLDTWAVKYIHTFEAFDKLARVDVTQVYPNNA